MSAKPSSAPSGHPSVAVPSEQAEAMRKAIRIEWITIAYTSVTIALIALVVGNSQSMKTAWIEDMLSLVPQISFLIAARVIRKPASSAFPFGKHRAMSVGHLVAGVALAVVGLNLAVESVIGLVSGEHPTIGTVQLFGATVWLGWLMVAAMAVIVIGPFFYGRAKLKLAPVLHNKLLYADAAMARADWHTNAASIIGVLGVGVGLWWLDGAAAVFISVGIVRDGVRNTRYAVRDLVDERARTHDDSEPHPLIESVLAVAAEQGWIRDAGIRIRDLGQLFDAAIFVVPEDEEALTTDACGELADRIRDLDWKLRYVSVIPVARVPDDARF